MSLASAACQSPSRLAGEKPIVMAKTEVAAKNSAAPARYGAARAPNIAPFRLLIDAWRPQYVGRADLLALDRGESDDGAFGAPERGPRLVQGGRGRRPARQDKRAQGAKLFVQRVDRALERLNLRRRDAQRRPRVLILGLRQAEIGAEVEEIVLGARKRGLDGGEGGIVRFRRMQTGEADGAVRLVHLADGDQARVRLRAAAAVAKPRLAGISLAGIDDVQANHGLKSESWRAA